MDAIWQLLTSITWAQFLGIAFGITITFASMRIVISNPNIAADVLSALFIPVGKSDAAAAKFEALSAKIIELEDLTAELRDRSIPTKSPEGQSADADNAYVDASAGSTRPELLPEYSPSSYASAIWPHRQSHTTRMLDSMIAANLASGHDPRSLDDLFTTRRQVEEEEMRIRQMSSLESAFEQQLSSSTRIRGLMLNLFVIVNIGMIAALLLRTEQVLSAKELVFGLYIRFATFMVYVYRSSNARALILLAGKEDLKKYHDAAKYITSLGKRAPTERDIDLLKILTLNRMERERGSEHPYEMVLKGITNSNISFKGGKISAAKIDEKERKTC